MKRLYRWRVVRRVTTLASGVLLLQAGGCAIDDTTLTTLLNVVLEAYLSSATAAY